MWIFLDQTQGRVCEKKVRTDTEGSSPALTRPPCSVPEELWLDRPLEAGGSRAANLSTEDSSVLSAEMKLPSLVAQMGESPHSAADLGSIPGLGRSPGDEKAHLAWRIPWVA